MKKIMLVFFTTSISISLSAQWDETQNGQVTTLDQVGIGIDSPSSEVEIANTGDVALHVKSLPGAKQSSATVFLTSQGNSYVGQSGTSGRLLNSANAGDFVIGNRTGGAVIFSADAQHIEQHVRLVETGMLGIGVTVPKEKVQINGNLLLNSFSNGTESGIYFRDGFHSTSNNKYNLSILSYNDGDGSADALGINAYDGIYFNTGSNVKSTRMFIHPDGQVGIGTTNPDSKLTVAGKVHSKEVRVTIDAGADFVFDESYALRSLEETEKYINQNKHLPEIASEKEMLEKGLHVGEMNIKLLQKVEELTLYLIEQNKENKEQQRLIEELQKEISVLKNK